MLKIIKHKPTLTVKFVNGYPAELIFTNYKGKIVFRKQAPWYDAVEEEALWCDEHDDGF